MTSISSANHSPRHVIQDQLLSQISSGKIKSADKDALTAALDDIDSTLKSQATGGGPSTLGDIQSKIDDLISGEVKNGKLTSDQAKELKNLISSAAPEGHEGLPSSTGDTSTFKSTDDLISEFLKSITSSSSSYSKSGHQDTSSQGSLFFDYNA